MQYAVECKFCIVLQTTILILQALNYIPTVCVLCVCVCVCARARVCVCVYIYIYIYL